MDFKTWTLSSRLLAVLVDGVKGRLGNSIDRKLRQPAQSPRLARVWALAYSSIARDKEHIVRRPTMLGHVVVEKMGTHKAQRSKPSTRSRPLES